MRKILVQISARHIHLNQKDLEALFGKGYKLKKLKELYQPHHFAAKETVDIKVGKKILSKVRIVGPIREKTQIELSLTDTIKLGVKAQIRKSGDLQGTPGATLINKKKKIKIKEGLIVPARHIHCTPQEAQIMKLKNRKSISIAIKGKRALVFKNVQVRIDKDFKLCMHIDTDEGNAAGISCEAFGYLLNNE
jgi:propanediol utilization protein